jgi:hypothetical protein
LPSPEAKVESQEFMKVSTRKISKAGALVGAILYVHVSQAAEALPEAMRACVTLKRDAERLACYDRAAASLEAGSGGATATSPENMFGAHTALTPKPKDPPEAKREELQQITGQVVSVGHSQTGLMELALDNDQVWRQHDGEAALIIQTGDSVTISRASLGTFRITDKRGRSARFRRVR